MSTSSLRLRRKTETQKQSNIYLLNERNQGEKTKMENRKIQWLPTLLIVWNLIDIVVHVGLNMAEPWRIAGNIVGIVAALIVFFGMAKSYAPHILGGAAVVVVVVNAIHAAAHGFVIPMLVFIGFALFLLLRWTQVILAKGVDQNFYYRWWMALVVALVGVGIITLSGPRASLPIILNQLHDGALEGADYWRAEPVILSAGMGFDNIIGLPELTEETVR
ncbi:MAG: hypothetical protein WBE17_00740, partial [Anaerolineae bacterium]